jgi:hypothetical protein
MTTTHLTAEPLNLGAPEIGAPRLGQVHVLQAEPFAAGYQLKAARTRKRMAYMVELCRTVLRERLWLERFPTREELPHREYLKKAKRVLKSDPRTKDLPVDRMRKTLMRAGYRER